MTKIKITNGFRNLDKINSYFLSCIVVEGNMAIANKQLFIENVAFATIDSIEMINEFCLIGISIVKPIKICVSDLYGKTIDIR